ILNPSYISPLVGLQFHMLIRRSNLQPPDSQSKASEIMMLISRGGIKLLRKIWGLMLPWVKRWNETYPLLQFWQGIMPSILIIFAQSLSLYALENKRRILIEIYPSKQSYNSCIYVDYAMSMKHPDIIVQCGNPRIKEQQHFCEEVAAVGS
ncbi:7357_t:CDS:2, partial [Paraglomus brasilianum]